MSMLVRGIYAADVLVARTRCRMGTWALPESSNRRVYMLRQWKAYTEPAFDTELTSRICLYISEHGTTDVDG